MVKMSFIARNAALQHITDLVDAAAAPGVLEIYGGRQPDSADEGAADRPLLATLSFAKPAFGRPGNWQLALGRFPMARRLRVAARHGRGSATVPAILS